MKRLGIYLSIIAISLLFACNNSKTNEEADQARADSIEMARVQDSLLQVEADSIAAAEAAANLVVEENTDEDGVTEENFNQRDAKVVKEKVANQRDRKVNEVKKVTNDMQRNDTRKKPETKVGEAINIEKPAN